jgi:stage V sporulation protein SpoVS
VTSPLLDRLVFSSLWVGGAASSLSVATSLAMGIPIPWAAVGVALAGTVFVYNVDRLRDLPRDLDTAPERSAFVARNYGVLRGLAVAAGIAAVGLALSLGPRSALLLGPALILGLVHRRIKDVAWGKSSYITAAWLLVVVGLPAIAGPDPEGIGWVASILAGSLFANAIASNVRDREAAVARIGAGRALAAARAVAALALALAAVAPPGVRPLAAVPAMTLASLVWFRSEERYGLVVVDGALLAGGVLAALLLAFD